MAEQETPLAATFEEFDRARGDEADGAWAFAAAWPLLRRDVEPEVIDKALHEVLTLVRDSQESPRELYGPPDVWADERLDEWYADGRRVHRQGPQWTWRELPASGLAWSSFIAFLLGAWQFLDGQATWGSPGALAVALGLGFGTVAAVTAWEVEHWRRSEVAAAAITAGAIVLTAVATSTAIWLADLLGVAGTTRVSDLLILGVVCAVLSRWWAARVRDDVVSARPGPATDDEEWERRAVAVLRAGAGLGDDRAREVIADARAHARDAGSSLQDEHGDPEDFAGGFAPDRARRGRRAGWLYLALALANCLWLLDGVRWPEVVLVLLLVALAVAELLRSRRPPTQA